MLGLKSIFPWNLVATPIKASIVAHHHPHVVPPLLNCAQLAVPDAGKLWGVPRRPLPPLFLPVKHFPMGETAESAVRTRLRARGRTLS